MRKQQKGFTLIELLVVIAIIGLLSTLAVVSFSGAQKRARDANRVSDIRQLQTAMESYNAQYASYIAYGCNDTAKEVSTCSDTNLKAIIPQIGQLEDPSWAAKIACVAGGSSDCDYGFGVATQTTYAVYFATENSDVQGLKARAYHTLTQLGIDAS